ncbi:unnamed protein product, partial [marine sediment metagenome]
SSNVQGRFLRAHLLLEKQQFSEAGEVLDTIINDQPRHAGAHYYRGLIYLAEKDQARAKGALLKAVEYNPINLKARILLAEVYLAERAPDLALEQLKIVLTKEPGNYQAHLHQGNAYLLKRDIKSSRQFFEKAAKISPDDPTAYYRLAGLDSLQRRYDPALSQLNKVLELKADHLPALAAKVSIYMAQKQPAEALAFLEEKLRAHQKNARLAAALHEMRGSVLFVQKDYDQSEAAFKKALNLNPDLVGPYLSLARLYHVTKETDEAINQYQAILAKQPEFIQAYMALGTIYDAEGKSAKARKMYEKALEVNPDFAPAANNLAWILLQTGADPNGALNLAKKAKAQLPDDPRVADTLGLALITKGLGPSAIAEFEDAALKMPQNPTVLYHLGLAHWKNGEKNHALEALRKALKTKRPFPEEESGRKLLKEIEATK